MSPSTAPPLCSLTRTAWIVPLTRPQTVTFCAMTLPSTCAPSLIWRSEARTSPSIRPKTCAGPLHSMLPTIDMSEPMQEAIPAFVVGSDFAQGLVMLHHPANDLSRILLGHAALRADQHVHLLFSPVIRVPCANRTASSTQHQRYHLLSAAGLNSSRNRNFVHMKGERGGVVGPAFSGGTRQNSTRLLYR